MAWRIHGNVGRHHPVHFFSFAHATSAVRTTKSNDLSDANKKYKRHTHTHTHTHTHPSQPLRIAEWRRALRTWRPRIPFPFFFISKAKKKQKKTNPNFRPHRFLPTKKKWSKSWRHHLPFCWQILFLPSKFPSKDALDKKKRNLDLQTKRDSRWENSEWDCETKNDAILLMLLFEPFHLFPLIRPNPLPSLRWNIPFESKPWQIRPSFIFSQLCVFVKKK